MFVPMIFGSKIDEPHARKIAETLEEFGIKTEFYALSAHKVPELVLDLISELNQSDEAICYITGAGRSNALSGVVAANAIHPVISCPPFSDKADYLANINSSVNMPSNTPSMIVTDPQNAALAAIKILALTDKKLAKKVAEHIQEVKESF